MNINNIFVVENVGTSINLPEPESCSETSKLIQKDMKFSFSLH